MTSSMIDGNFYIMYELILEDSWDNLHRYCKKEPLQISNPYLIPHNKQWKQIYQFNMSAQETVYDADESITHRKGK